MTAPTHLVLSLFPGIGLLDMAFEEHGFCVVRGPDTLWGGDVKRFHPPAGKFDGVIGGPPCQAFSRLRHLVEHNGYAVAENLIPEYERVVAEAQPAWFLMENVPAAPEARVAGYVVRSLMLNNRWCGGEQNRERRFAFGTRDGRVLLPRVVALEALNYVPAVLASGGGRETPVRLGGSGRPKRSRRGGPILKARDLGYKTNTNAAAAAAQCVPEGFLDAAPFTVAGKIKVLGNGVPLPLGRAIAAAVREAMYPREIAQAAPGGRA